jgi:cephalosporin hydroxylase
MDAWIIQELICKVKPFRIVETGTGSGGSALFYASILRLIGAYGQVITIDIEDKHLMSSDLYIKIFNLWSHRIQFIHGDSIKEFLEIKSMVETALCHFSGGSIMVLLDSWHTKDHVLKEMELYSQLVTVDSYLIVEDTHVNGHPVPWEYGDGPYEAVREFLSKRDDFVVDKECERLGMTFNPSGYLKRVR